jgi:mono/diheme cytochrome c family protein
MKSLALSPSAALAALVVVSGALAVFVGCTADMQQDATPFVQASTPDEAGRYLTVIGGCNDCHTADWNETEGQVPESEWLTGKTLGYRGPWGTTYGTNLRLSVPDMSEDAWLEMCRTATGRPPMPWMNMHELHERDLRAIYRYITSLGRKGDPAPAYLPPDEEPPPPYFELVAPEPTSRATPG